MEKGLLIVVSGFSGAGKGTLMKRLLEKYPDQYALSVSATTRAPREGEQNGREYFFVSTETFEAMIAEGALIEHAKYVSNYYGTPRAYVMEKLEEGRDVLLEIELQGAFQIREQFPQAVLIFVTPPSAEELKRRLTGRGTETDDVIAARMRRAVEESVYMDRYDYLLVNDDLEACVDEMHRLIAGQHTRCCEQETFIGQMRKDIKKITENPDGRPSEI